MGLCIDGLTPEAIAQLVEIGQRLRTQNNRATDAPIFCVEERRRVYGFDPAYSDNVAWVDGDGDEADTEEHARLEAAWDETGEEPQDWTRTCYQESWEYVTACFTEAGCQDYIQRNGHRHRGELRTFASTSYRNDEWRAVRALLMALAGGAS